jgi:hypothetical protein
MFIITLSSVFYSHLPFPFSLRTYPSRAASTPAASPSKRRRTSEGAAPTGEADTRTLLDSMSTAEAEVRDYFGELPAAVDWASLGADAALSLFTPLEQQFQHPANAMDALFPPAPILAAFAPMQLTADSALVVDFAAEDPPAPQPAVVLTTVEPPAAESEAAKAAAVVLTTAEPPATESTTGVVLTTAEPPATESEAPVVLTAVELPSAEAAGVVLTTAEPPATESEAPVALTTVEPPSAESEAAVEPPSAEAAGVVLTTVEPPAAMEGVSDAVVAPVTPVVHGPRTPVPAHDMDDDDLPEVSLRPAVAAPTPVLVDSSDDEEQHAVAAPSVTHAEPAATASSSESSESSDEDAIPEGAAARSRRADATLEELHRVPVVVAPAAFDPLARLMSQQVSFVGSRKAAIVNLKKAVDVCDKSTEEGLSFTGTTVDALTEALAANTDGEPSSRRVYTVALPLRLVNSVLTARYVVYEHRTPSKPFLRYELVANAPVAAPLAALHNDHATIIAMHASAIAMNRIVLFTPGATGRALWHARNACTETPSSASLPAFNCTNNPVACCLRFLIGAAASRKTASGHCDMFDAPAAPTTRIMAELADRGFPVELLDTNSIALLAAHIVHTPRKKPEHLVVEFSLPDGIRHAVAIVAQPDGSSEIFDPLPNPAEGPAAGLFSSSKARHASSWRSLFKYLGAVPVALLTVYRVLTSADSVQPDRSLHLAPSTRASPLELVQGSPMKSVWAAYAGQAIDSHSNFKSSNVPADRVQIYKLDDDSVIVLSPHHRLVYYVTSSQSLVFGYIHQRNRTRFLRHLVTAVQQYSGTLSHIAARYTVGAPHSSWVEA